MVTIAEYKAFLDGATGAPWTCKPDETTEYIYMLFDADGNFQEEPDMRINAAFISASREIAPSLIRVIELAEEALETCGVNRHGQEYHDWDKIKQALSEIRRLKGE